LSFIFNYLHHEVVKISLPPSYATATHGLAPLPCLFIFTTKNEN